MSVYTIQNILVPVDLSESSLNALDTAAALAQKHKASLQLLNVVEHQWDAFQEDAFSPGGTTDSLDVLNALAGSIQHTHNLKPSVIQEEGNVSDTIIKASIKYQSSLIVMGTHGASGYRDGFMGSNTYRVIKQAGCAVLAVPDLRKYLSFRRIVFPIRPVAGALQRYDIVCHFVSPQSCLEVLGLSYRKMERETNVLDKIVQEIKDQLDADKIKPSISWGAGRTVADDVLSFAHQDNSDLIIITSVLDVTTKPKFVGPHTQKIINCAKAPILSIKKAGVVAGVVTRQS
jgi:nucleotide-binding universal stress UspA family protein